MRKSCFLFAALLAGAPAAAQNAPIYKVGDEIEIKVGGRWWRPCVVTSPGAQYAVGRARCSEFKVPGFTYVAMEEIFPPQGSTDVRRRGAAAAAPVARPVPATRPAAAPAPRAPAAPQTAAVPDTGVKMERCYVGQRVFTPAGRPSTVVAAPGAGCTIHSDGDAPNVTSHWGAFMLTPAKGSRVIGPNRTGLPIGEYACYGSGQRVLAGLGFKLLAGGRYTDLDGNSSGTYRVVGNNVTFTGGHLGGQTGRDIKDNGFTIGAMASCQKW